MVEPVLREFPKGRGKGRDFFDRWNTTLTGSIIVILITVMADHLGNFLWDQITDPFAIIKAHTEAITKLSGQFMQLQAAQDSALRTLQSVDNRTAVVEAKTASMEGKLAVLLSLRADISRTVRKAQSRAYADMLRLEVQGALADGKPPAPPSQIWSTKPGN